MQIIVNNAGTHDDAAFPGMRLAHCHCVINISSVATLSGNRGQLNCAASKGALNSATKALSLEVASRGVKVNAIAPSITFSPMADGSFDKDMIERLAHAKRAGTPEEVAALAGFLASPEASYITGQAISVNGGLY